MKHKRLIPILLALTIVLIASSALAATSCVVHTWSEWMPEPNFPTCTESGGRTRVCTVCGTWDDWQSMPALGHDWVRGSTSYNGCESPASVTYTCSRCGAQESRQEAAPGHSWYESGRKAPTCADDGYVEHACSRCGESYRETLKATGDHKYGAWVMDEPATCKERELQRCACKVCGKLLWRYVGELGPHQWEETARVEPTCGADGLSSRVCTVCGEKSDEVLPATGNHQFGEWVTLMNATRREGGTEQRVCSVCGYQENRKTDPLPYDEENLEVFVRQISEEKELYVPGDVITLEVTLHNGSSFGYAESKVSCDRNESLAPEDDYDSCFTDALGQGDSVTDTIQYTITEEDLANGCVVLPFIGIGYFPDGFTPALPELEAPGAYIPTVSNSEAHVCVFFTGTDREPLETALVLTVTQTSLEKTIYKVGDTMTFTVEMTNVSDCRLISPVINRFYQYVPSGDVMMGLVTYSGEENNILALEPGETYTITDTYTLAEEDVTDGFFELTWQGAAEIDLSAGVPYISSMLDHNASGQLPDDVLSNPITLRLPSKNPDGFDSLGLGLHVDHVSAEKPFYQEGDVLDFDLSLTNNSTVYLTNPLVTCDNLNTESEADRAYWDTDMAPGTPVIGNTHYTVTAEDVARGCFVLRWDGGAALTEADWPRLDPEEYDPHTWAVAANSVTLTFAASEDPRVPPVYDDAGLTLSAHLSSYPKESYAEGETVAVALSLRNTGTVTLYDPNIDIHVDDGGYYFAGDFTPGEERPVTHFYTITPQDAADHCAVLIFDGLAVRTSEYLSYAIPEGDLIRSNTCVITLFVDGTAPEPEDTEPTPQGEPRLALTAVTRNPKETYELIGAETEDIVYDLTVKNIGSAPYLLTRIHLRDSGGSDIDVTDVPETLLYPDQEYTTSVTWRYYDTDVIPGTASETLVGEVEIAFQAFGKPTASAAAQGGEFGTPAVSLRHKLAEPTPSTWSPPLLMNPGTLTITKSLFSQSAEAEGYQADEWVVYAITLKNNTVDTLSDIQVVDSLCVVYPDHGDTVTENVGDLITLIPGEERTLYYKYQVRQEDVGCEYISNTAHAHYVNPYTQEPDRLISNCIIVYVIETPDPVEQRDPNPRPDPNPQPDPATPDVVVVKWIDGDPANGHYYVPGEPIHYHVMAYNNSSYPFRNFRCYDALAIERADQQIGSAPELAPFSWSADMAFDYVVTEYDAAVVGEVYNDAMVIVEDDFGMPFYYWSTPVIAPAGVDDPTKSVSIVKIETSYPGDGRSFYIAGEQITYDLLVYNNTDEPIYMLDVYDILADAGSLPPYHVFSAKKLDAHSALAPIPFTYTVTESDIPYDYVSNVASLTYNAMEDGPLDPQFRIDSNEVLSPVGKVEPGPTPNVKEQPKAKPRPTGSLSLPKPTDTLADSCSFTLMAEGAYAVDMKLHLCAKHSAMAAQAEQLLAEATDPSTGWQQAIDLWSAEVDALYDALLNTAQGTARATVAEDQAAFKQYLGTLREQLQQMYPNDVQAVNSRLATLLRDRCAELCYELNNANVARADSLRTGSYIALVDTVPTAECQRTEAHITGSDIQYRLSLCGEHGPVEEAVSQQLIEAKTQGDAVRAGQRAQRKWQMSLDALTNLYYKKAAPAERTVIAANRVAFDQLLAKRQALLSLVYPSHPEIVAEMMCQIVRDNVLMMCEGWK